MFPAACAMLDRDAQILLDTKSAARASIASDPMAVREGLRQLFDTLLLRSIPEDGRGTAQIVLAEALNNIVEHAYARHQGEIEITLNLKPTELHCKIIDSGLPMPGEVLPEGKLAPLDELGELPEGGFGWHLIRTLSHDLSYSRIGGKNHLSFRLET
jgi:serine/threonine-protein kinase RsbW